MADPQPLTDKDTENALGWLRNQRRNYVEYPAVAAMYDLCIASVVQARRERDSLARQVMTDPKLIHIAFDVCNLCLAGRGGECHVPGCAFWMADAPTGSAIDWLNDRRAWPVPGAETGGPDD